ncbi:MAG: hypothetical protein KDD94_08715 [Calditrichaeota bacterium]|nr:hypothetical protein [Calditrichota bacterium]
MTRIHSIHCISLLTLCFLFSCTQQISEKIDYQFTENGVVIDLAEIQLIHSVSIYKSEQLIKKQLINFGTKRIQIDFEWQTATDYQLEIERDDKPLKNLLHSPANKDSKSRISIALPFGQQEIDLGDGQSDTLIVYRTDWLEGLLKINRSNRTHSQVRLSSDHPIFDHSNHLDLSDDSIRVEQVLFRRFNLELPDSRILRIHYSIRQTGALADSGEIILDILSAEHLKQSILISGIDRNTNASGLRRETESPNTIFINTAFFSRIQSFFGRQLVEFNHDQPYTFVTAHLENKQDFAQIVIADLQVYDPQGNTATAFRPRDRSLSSYSESSKASVQLEPNSVANLSVPVFVDQLAIEAGEYRMKLQLRLFGYADPFFETSYPLYVNQSYWERFAIYLFFVVLGISGLIVFVRMYHRYIHNFPVAILITTAIFAAIHFVFTYIAFLLDSTFFAILGPFRSFISAMISEGISSAILISLVLVYPQRGVVSLKLLISFLLSAVLTGALYLHNLPAFGLRILLLESALIISGFYLLRNERSRSYLTAFCLALANAIMSYYTLLENQVLFRLFYAGWYMIAFIGITGFVYSFLAILVSWNLGLKLREVIR